MMDIEGFNKRDIYRNFTIRFRPIGSQNEYFIRLCVFVVPFNRSGLENQSSMSFVFVNLRFPTFFEPFKSWYLPSVTKVSTPLPLFSTPS